MLNALSMIKCYLPTIDIVIYFIQMISMLPIKTYIEFRTALVYFSTNKENSQ